MAKKIMKIERFEGGLNNQSHIRDIEDNESSILQGLSVSDFGQIVRNPQMITINPTIGSRFNGSGVTWTTNAEALKKTFKKAGFYTMAADYKNFAHVDSEGYENLLQSATASLSLGGRIYYIINYDNDIIKAVSTHDEDEITAQTIFDFGGTTGALDSAPVYYEADGALRVSPTAFRFLPYSEGAVPKPQIRKRIKGKLLLGPDQADNVQWQHCYNNPKDGGVEKDYWCTTDAEIKGCFPEENIAPSITEEDTTSSTLKVMAGINLLAGQRYYSDYWRDTIAETNALFEFAGGKSDTGSSGAAGGGSTGMYWGCALLINEANAGTGTGTWQVDEKTRYAFYITTIYDGEQESLPQLFKHYPSGNLKLTSENHTDQAAASSMKFLDKQSNEYTIDDWGDPGEGGGFSVAFCPVIKIHGAKYEETTDVIAQGKGYNLGASTVDARDGGNPRITGLRFYWADSDDGFVTKYLLMEWDLEKGVRPIGSNGSSVSSQGYVTPDGDRGAWDSVNSWYAHVHGGGEMTHTWKDGGFQWDDPPKYFEYEVLNQHTDTETITVDGYAAACVLNRRAYIGNIMQDGVVHSDRMLKSQVGQFDKFPSVSNRIDVAIDDGDEIIALHAFADRILQFKKRKLYVINASGASEFLESQHDFKGVSSPGCVATTDIGVVWVNKHGAYLYNGNSVTDLHLRGGLKKISNRETDSLSLDWSDDLGDLRDVVVGFNPTEKKMIVKNSSSGAWFYDFNFQSWSYSVPTSTETQQAIGDDAAAGGCTNIINDIETGTPMIFHRSAAGADEVRSWRTTGGPGYINWESKDWTFGNPGVKKKIYRVILTYRGTNASALEFFYTPDGGTGRFKFESDPLSYNVLTNQVHWGTLEFKPSNESDSSNNIYSFKLGIVGIDTIGDFGISDISVVYREKRIK